MRYFLLCCFALAVVGCSKPAIREATVYKAEIDFVDAATQEVVERGKAVLDTQCVCVEPVEGIKTFKTQECSQLAETVLVLDARMKYHTDYMRFLGGVSDVRPEGDAPDVPDVGTLCEGK